MGQSRVGRPFQDGERLRIVRQAVGIQQPDGQLVVGVGGKTALAVELAGDGLGVEPIEPQHLFANGAVAANRIAPRQGRHPLAEVAAGREAFVEVFPIVVVGAIGVPAAQFDARRGQARHLAERHQQAVVAQATSTPTGCCATAPHARRWRSTRRHSRIQRAERARAARLPMRQRRGETPRRRQCADLQKAPARHAPVTVRIQRHAVSLAFRRLSAMGGRTDISCSLTCPIPPKHNPRETPPRSRRRRNGSPGSRGPDPYVFSSLPLEPQHAGRPRQRSTSSPSLCSP